MDDRVTAHVFLELAKANDRLARLEALEKEVPVLSGTSNARLRLSRRITNARKLAQSWASVYSMTEIAESNDKVLAQERAGLEKEFPPERSVAWRHDATPDGPDLLVCNRNHGLCKWGYESLAGWVPLKALDLPEGGICDQCGTDVLA